MEIVIEIPEDEYQNILHTGRASFCAVNAIEAGTLLPKGHGRLIDADIAIQKLGDDNEDAYAEFVLNDAPTIIEADRGEE